MSATAVEVRQWSFGAGVRAAAARFWLGGVLMWSLEHWPWLARTTKPFFLWWAWNTSRFLRGNLTDNARHLLGPGSTRADRRRLAKRVLANHWEFISDFARMRHWSAERLLEQVVEVEGEATYRRVRAERRGLILVTAHLGAFEVGLAATARRERAVHVVFARDTMPTFDRLRSERHRALGVIEAPLDDGLVVWLELRDALARDEVVLMQGDRVMPGQKGQTVDFLGAPRSVPTGPVRLAMVTGAPLMPVFCLHTDDRQIRIVLEPPIDVEHGDVAAAVRDMAGAIERCVRAHPEQWLMVHRAWTG